MRIKRIETSAKFDRSFSKLSLDIQKETIKRKIIFKQNLYDSRLRTHKLKGQLQNYWSFSINHSHRIVFKFINKNEVMFYDIGDHRIYQ